ncbi:MAG: AsmA-like C-terminal region-containing protein [Candidatus Gastranaerophilales bacterium]
MNLTLKKVFLSLVSVVLLSIYVYFLFFLPKRVDINQYKDIIVSMTKEFTNYDLQIDNLNLETTPLFGVVISAEGTRLNLPDGSKFVSLPFAKARLSLPNLLLLNVRLSEVVVENPSINLEIDNGTEFRAIKTIEDVLYNLEKQQDIQDISEKKGFDPLTLIRINLPNISVYNYEACIKDNLIDEFLLLSGDMLKLGYFNGKKVKFQTQAELYLNDEKNADFDINIESFIPQAVELDNEDDPYVRAEVPMINPVTVYKNYDFRGNIASKIKLSEGRKGINANGYFNIDDFTLNLGGYKIPESYLRTKFKGAKTNVDTSLYITDEQYLNLNGFIKLAKRPSFDINLFSNGVYFNDLILLAKGLLNSFGLNNELDNFVGTGYFSADTSIKTNFKKIKSSGDINVVDGAIENIKTKLGISNINADISLNNNSLNIDAGLNIDEGELKISGVIDEKSIADINLVTNKIPLRNLFIAFAPEDIKKEIYLNSGLLSLELEIKGKLKKIVAKLMTKVEDFSLSDKLNTILITNEEFDFDLLKDKKLAGKIVNTGFKLALPYASSQISNDDLELMFDEKNLDFNPIKVRINSESIITFVGKVEDYINSPKFDVVVDGNLYANELKSLLGVMAEPFLDAKGVIPLKATFVGDNSRQTLVAQIVSDANNYITPFHIHQIKDYQSIIQLVVDFKENRIKIKDSGLYAKLLVNEFTSDFEANLLDMDKVFNVEGTIACTNSSSPMINLFRMNLLNPISFNICGLDGSKIALNGDLSLFGNVNSPRYKGGFSATKIRIPDLALFADEIKLDFNGKEGEISTENLIVDASDFEFSSNINLAKLPLLSLERAKLNSTLIDTDGLLKVSEEFFKILPEDPVEYPVEQPQADIPLEIVSGGFDIISLKSGAIYLSDTVADMRLLNNVFFIDDLSTNVFDGNVSGDISVDLLSYLMGINLSGQDMDTNDALIALANLKDTLSGDLSFETNFILKGMTYEEQVKSLRGYVKFLIEDGKAGPFSKIENIFMSENLRSSDFFKDGAGSSVTSAVTIDTARFEELEGRIDFKGDGVAYIDSITMFGKALCMNMFGEMDILQNTLDMKLRGRLGSVVSSVLGPLANLNPINIVKSTPGLNVAMVKAFAIFCEEVGQEEIDAIPDFSNKSDMNATKFQLVLAGDLLYPMKLLKSFKWLVTIEEFNKAEEYVVAIPDEMPEGVETMEQVLQYQKDMEEYKENSKTLSGKIKNMINVKNAPDGYYD